MDGSPEKRLAGALGRLAAPLGSALASALASALGRLLVRLPSLGRGKPGGPEDPGGRAGGPRASEARLRTAIEQSPLSIHVFAPDGRSLLANASWDELWYLGEDEAPEGKNVFEDEQLKSAGLIPYIKEGVAGRTAVTPPLLYDPGRTGREGDPRWLRGLVYPVEDEGTGEVSEVTLMLEDITERKRAEEELRLKNRALNASSNGVIITDATAEGDNPIVYFNPAIERITGYPAEEVLGRDPRFLQGPDGDQPEVRKLRRAIREEREYFGVLKNYKKDGAAFYNEMYVSPVRDEDGCLTHFVGVQNDVTERRRMEERIAHQALHDPLTGLPNRALFLDRLGQALSRAGRKGGGVAILFVDLDGFKHVNDSLGHEAGDELLLGVAGRLKGRLRPADTVARFGGDEFAVLLEDAGGEGEAVRAVERIARELEAPFAVGDDGREVFAVPATGIALGGGAGGAGPQELLKRADLAMYEAKRRGRGEARHAVYEESMGRRAGERLDLENDLRRAVARGEFEAHYQPKVELSSGRVAGFEALARWRHPERGVVLPGGFVPLAEETGLIVEIGRQILREACSQARRWRERWEGEGSPPTVWANLSARQLHETDLAEKVRAILRETGLEPGGLGLEVTESVLMGDGAAGVARLEELKTLGIKLAVDDFGTGYSSLSYLKRLPVDLLKIDRSFVGGLGEDAGDATIVSAVVGLARAMGLGVVAEGVETEEQLVRLEEMGCDLAQGYYFARPLPGEAVEALE